MIDHPFFLVDLRVVPHVESCVDFCWLNPLVSRQDMITKARAQRKVTGTRWSMDKSPINNRVSWDFTGITGIHTVISRVFYDGCPLIFFSHRKLENGALIFRIYLSKVVMILCYFGLLEGLTPLLSMITNGDFRICWIYHGKIIAAD